MGKKRKKERELFQQGSLVLWRNRKKPFYINRKKQFYKKIALGKIISDMNQRDFAEIQDKLWFGFIEQICKPYDYEDRYRDIVKVHMSFPLEVQDYRWNLGNMNLIKDKMDMLFSHCEQLRDSFKTTMDLLKVWGKNRDEEILEELCLCLGDYFLVLKHHLKLSKELQVMLDLSLGGHVAA